MSGSGRYGETASRDPSTSPVVAVVPRAQRSCPPLGLARMFQRYRGAAGTRLVTTSTGCGRPAERARATNFGIAVICESVRAGSASRRLLSCLR